MLNDCDLIKKHNLPQQLRRLPGKMSFVATRIKLKLFKAVYCELYLFNL